MKDKIGSLLAGPTNKQRVFDIARIDLRERINQLGLVAASNLDWVDIIPDDGIPLELAKAYKSAGGKKVVGHVPIGGREYLSPYFEYCDDVLDFDGGWSAINTCLSLRSDLITVVGMSAGTMVEIAYTKYHNRYFNRVIPVALDRTTIKEKIPFEVDEDIDLHYFTSPDELDR